MRIAVIFPTSAPGYSGLTDKDQGADDIDSDANTSTGKTDTITLTTANKEQTDVDGGLLSNSIDLEGTNVSEDTLSGGSGDETIAGYKGQDTLTGGGGSDTFFFNETSEGVDVITDFTVYDSLNPNPLQSDKIDLSQILADEVTDYSSGDPFAQGYVLLTQYSTLDTMVQIDFDAGDNQLPKSIVLLENVAVNDLDTTENFII